MIWISIWKWFLRVNLYLLIIVAKTNQKISIRSFTLFQFLSFWLIVIGYVCTVVLLISYNCQWFILSWNIFYLRIFDHILDNCFIENWHKALSKINRINLLFSFHQRDSFKYLWIVLTLTWNEYELRIAFYNTVINLNRSISIIRFNKWTSKRSFIYLCNTII